MARSRYPRRGQRLAPATLRELLREPVPAKYLQGQKDAPVQLCDLDETAWERFSEQTCLELGGQIVAAVGRAARMPIPIGDRRLPMIPAGLSLADLELEVRTVNCLVAAGIHERPQDLRMMTIEGILSLRGFWVKCLVDLLTSLEHVRDHPQARRRLRKKGGPGLRTPRPSGRYPRPGNRLAPHALREILTAPVPAELVRGTPFEGAWLCDLDEQVWDHLAAEAVGEAAALIVARVNVSASNRAIQQRRLPRLPKGIRLEDLCLENRTYNCLRREGFAKHPEELGRRTIGEMLMLKAFGAKCLVDLLSSLETLAAREGKLDEKLTAQAKALAALPGVSGVHFSDPRLGRLLRATGSDANTVGELVNQVLKRRLDPPDSLRLYQQMCELHRRLEQLMHLPLEEELIQILAPVGNDRDRTIVAEYYGWDGGGGCTLEELGTKYGLSRERIRQVCVRAVKRNRRSGGFAPVLDRALAFVAERVPMSAERVAEEFRAAGLSGCGLSLEAVRQAAGFLSRDPKFTLVSIGKGQVAVRPDQVGLPRVIVQTAKRAVLSYGVTRISEVAREVASQTSSKVDHTLIEETLKTLGDFYWLDRKGGWFRLESVPQYGLSNMIDKVLAVTGQIDVSKLRAAIARYRRVGRSVPPTKVLLEFCRQSPGVRVEGNRLIADPPKDWREVLAGVEAGMVEVLKDHGPVMERGAFEEHCIRKGMNRFSFNAIIMCSPVIAQYGRSVYGLLGAKVDSKTIEAMVAKKSRTALAKVLKTYGQTSEGEAYLAYRLSKAAISGGVITVPAAMKDLVRGKYAICTAEGRRAGTLVSKSGCAWGLGPVLRSNGAQPGDHLVILFDAEARSAHIILGDESVLDSVAGAHQGTA